MFHPLDHAIIYAYFAFLVVIGVQTARRKRRDGVAENEDYMVAGRTLTLPAFVATLVATWYGGILGVGEMAYNTGIGTWTVFGLPYYLYAFLYAIFLAHRVRTTESLTIPDVLQKSHGKTVALVGAVIVFLLITPAPYVLMLGTLFQGIFGMSPILGLIVGTMASVIFVVTGGFNTDVRTNIFQFILMFASFAVMVGFAMVKKGDLVWLSHHVPPSHLQPSGGMAFGYLFVWYFLAMQTLVDPGFHQRVSAARDTKTARNGILVSIVCWAIFDFMTVTTGLYARALLPNLTDTVQAYPALSHLILPPGVKGLFWVGMLATVMSTVLSFTFVAAITLGRDIIWRANLTEKADDVFWTRVGVGLTSVLSIIAAIKLPQVVGLWYVFGSVFVPGLLVPLLTAYAPEGFRAPRIGTLLSMLAGTGGAALWLYLGASKGSLLVPAYPFGIEAMYVGLGASLFFYLVSRLFKPEEEQTSV